MSSRYLLGDSIMMGVMIGLLAAVWGWYLLPSRLPATKRLGLAPAWGLSITGLLWYLFWLTGLDWITLVFLWMSGALTLIFFGGYNLLRINQVSNFKDLNFKDLGEWLKSFTNHASTFLLPGIRKFLMQLTIGQLVVLFGATLSVMVVVVWNLFMRGVVWDALVLYDWRGLRIAEGWQLTDFFTQFVDHPEFYAYDFSHPFLDSLWRAFVFVAGGEVATGMYLVVFVGWLVYAYQVLNYKPSWWWLLLLMVATPQMLITWTQGYAALPYSLWWALILFIVLDKKIGIYKQTWLLLISLMANMLLRISEPFWLVFAVWWSGKIWFSDYQFLTKVALISYWLVPLVAIFGHWQLLQAEAITYVSLSASDVSRSSYDLGKYAGLESVVSTPLWWGQTTWLLLTQNYAATYSFLAISFLGLGVYGPVLEDNNKQKGQLDKDDIWLLILGAAWWLMLGAALLFEISGDPQNWLSKPRLLERVSLPLSMWGVVASARWWKKLNQNLFLGTQLEE